MNLDYFGGSDTILYSVIDNKFFSYEMEFDEIHTLYGGEWYYKSCSGLSRSGYISNVDDLIEFGFYRTDCSNEQQKQIVHCVDGKSIFGYVPIKSHKGIDPSMPVVLTDGQNIVFSSKNSVRDVLLNWRDLSKHLDDPKKINCQYVEGGELINAEFTLYNPTKWSKLNALRFADLREIRHDHHNIQVDEERSLTEVRCGIYKNTNQNLWYHRSNLGYYDAVYNSNPYDDDELPIIINNWCIDNDGIRFKRKGINVESFIEVEREIVFPKLYINGMPRYIHYENNDMPVIEWYGNVDNNIKFLFKQLKLKAIEDYKYSRSNDIAFIKNLMIEHREIIINKSDSFSVGNCVPGTDEFITKYKLKDGCTIGDLLDHPLIDEEMLKLYDFRKVIYAKL